MNWVRLDPWCSFRMVFHGYHPNSPLSHPELTRRAFFGDSFPATDVVPFQRRMNRYESFWWPLTMMRPFASAQAVLAGIENKGAKTTVLVMAGSQDALMDARVTRETTAFYRAASDEENVRIEFVNGAGHHLQNDVQWEDGAAKLLDFWTGL
jgi:alpha-beta hydrolase superfamily lysophospholipase